MDLVWSEARVTRGRGAPNAPYIVFALAEAAKAAAAPPGTELYSPAYRALSLRPARGPWSVVSVARSTRLRQGEIRVPILLPREVVNLRPVRGARRPAPAFPDWFGDCPCFVGIIDDAIGFAHERFRRAVAGGPPRSRIDYLWMQGVRSTGGTDLPFGRALWGAEIDRLLASHSLPGGAIDEDGLYRDPDAGLLEMASPRMQNGAQAFSHGTAMLDTAAGLAPDDPLGVNLPIAAVCLPPQLTTDTLGTFAETYLIAAIDRILRHVAMRSDQASRRAGRKVDYPLVINISLALTAGAKDGGDLLDRYLADLARSRRGRAPVIVVMPAGNHRQAQTHARLTAAGTVTWHLPPDDATPSFVEIWGPPRPERPAAPMAVRLTPPGGCPAQPAAAFGHHCRLLRDGRPVGWIFWDWRADPDGSGGRERVTCVTAPTVASGAAPWTPLGDWSIAVGGTGWPVDLHVQRDDTIASYRRRGRQSYFTDRDYQPRDESGRIRATDPDPTCPVRRAGTLTSLADGVAPILVGGYHARTLAEVDYAGLPFDPGEGVRRLDLLAPSEASPLLPGILAALGVSGGRARVSGTSIAAAAVTRDRSRALAQGGGWGRLDGLWFRAADGAAVAPAPPLLAAAVWRLAGGRAPLRID